MRRRTGRQQPRSFVGHRSTGSPKAVYFRSANAPLNLERDWSQRCMLAFVR